MIPSWRFHHIGIACEDIEREEAAFADLGYSREGAPFADARQGIRGVFLTGEGPRLELVAPFDETSTVLSGVLAQRLKMYHMAYLVADMAAGLAALKQQRGKIVVPPAPAVAFGGRDIAFVALPNRMLIELIEQA